MASISISNLRPAGYDLFLDADKYMEELSDSELNRVVGGTNPLLAVAVGFGAAYLLDRLF